MADKLPGFLDAMEARLRGRSVLLWTCVSLGVLLVLGIVLGVCLTGESAGGKPAPSPKRPVLVSSPVRSPLPVLPIRRLFFMADRESGDIVGRRIMGKVVPLDRKPSAASNKIDIVLSPSDFRGKTADSPAAPDDWVVELVWTTDEASAMKFPMPQAEPSVMIDAREAWERTQTSLLSPPRGELMIAADVVSVEKLPWGKSAGYTSKGKLLVHVTNLVRGNP
jgi:hypothetical protein